MKINLDNLRDADNLLQQVDALFERSGILDHSDEFESPSSLHVLMDTLRDDISRLYSEQVGA